MFVWVMELLLDTTRSGIGKHYTCRIRYILDAILDKANYSKEVDIEDIKSKFLEIKWNYFS